MPRMASGEETFSVTIPDGLQLSLVDLAVEEAGIASGAEVTSRPERGATGEVRFTVKWTHPIPAGSVRFRLNVYASPDGTPPPIITPITEPASHARMKLLVEQDAPVDVAIDGPIAQRFKTEIENRGGQLVRPQSADGLASPLVTGVEIAAFVGITLALIAATCVILGFATFGAVLLIAMQKGYNIDDAGYTTAVGEGDSRQEHKMVFNIRKPGT